MTRQEAASGDRLPIGVVGLGRMGGAVAGRLLKVGRDVIVYDLLASTTQTFAEQGAAVAVSAREAAERADVLLTVLPDGPDVERVALGGILAGTHKGLLWIEMSTIDPDISRSLARRAEAQGIRFVDAAIGGLTTQAATGKLVLMVGGDDADVARARPLLQDLSDAIHVCGPVGAGVTMKLVNNLLAGVIFAADCEALVLGRAAGLTVEAMLAVLGTTAADNAHLRRGIQKRVVPNDFEPGFRLQLQRKDARLALELAGRLGVPLPLGAQVQELRSAAIAQGLGEKDSAVLVQVLERLARVDMRTGQRSDTAASG